MSNGAAQKSKTGRERRAFAIAGLVLAAILFLSINVFSSATFRSAQLDLTENSLFTLSDGTAEVLGALSEPVTLRLFISPELLRANPSFAAYAARVQELLERYVALAKGKLTLEIINPEPFTPSEDRALGFGLQGVPLDQGGDRVYFGLAGTNTTDDSDVIAFFSPQREQFLEYDLTRLIYNLANPEKKVVALVTGTSMEADPAFEYRPWQVIAQMRQLFEVRSIIDHEKIDDTVDVLMVAHPLSLSDEMLYAIDQFVLRGGKAIFFVDPFSEEVTRSNGAQRLPPDTGSEVEKLFSAWGLEFNTDKFVGDRLHAQRVGAEGEGGGQIIVDFVAWQSARGEALNSDDVITGELDVLSFSSPGGIAVAEGAPISLDPLVTTSTDTMLIDTNKLRYRPDPQALLNDFKSEDKARVLAARVSGKLKSAFADGPPKPEDAKPEQTDAGADGQVEKPDMKAKPHLAESAGPINLIVVGDVDLLADRSWLQIQDFFGRQMVVPSANNGDFVINALDNLAGSTALISLRSRGLSARPFTTVEDIRRAAEERYRSTEQALAQKLEETEKKLKELQTSERGQGASIMSAEQRAAIDNFRAEMVNTRAALRDVQRALRRDIEVLDGWIKVLNIGAMPVLVLVVAIVLALARAGRRRRHLHGV